MSLTDQKKVEWESTLKEVELMAGDDSIQEHTQGDLWEFLGQTRGNYFFTNTKFIFVGGLGGSTNFSIPYNAITELKLCNVGGLLPIMPTGIKVTYIDEKGKTRNKKCSVLKRKDWLAYLTERSHVSAN